MTTRSFLLRLGVGILALNLLVGSLSWLSLARSRRQHEEKAAITAQNLAQVLEQNISGTLVKADVGITALVLEAERLLASGRLDRAGLVAYMAKLEPTLPELLGLRMATPEGELVHSGTPGEGPPVSVADRDYFVRLRDSASEGLVVTQPFRGRLIDSWVIVLARRVNRPDGSFGGVVFGSLPLARLDQLFSSLRVGSQGAFVLRDARDASLVLRHPEPEGAATPMGQRTLSPEFQEQVRLGHAQGTYVAASSLDHRVRLWGFRKFQNGLFYIFVGLSRDEYLAGWRQEVLYYGLFLAAFLGLTLAAGSVALRAWRNARAAEEEQRRLEQQLLDAQKLESLGVLAGGIAHDFNNILTVIIGNADLAMAKAGRESPAYDNLERIEEAGVQAADLAKQMLAYSGKGQFVLQSLDLNLLLEEMLPMLRVSISKKAALGFDLSKDLPRVVGDATQMRQVIMNLVINASEALGEGEGTITVRTGRTARDEAAFQDAWTGQEPAEGPYAFLEVADTGCGMDEATRTRIFEPFFTTKFTGRGLGMAVVLGIVRGHKGAIKVESGPGEGSCFRVMFPATGLPAEAQDHAGAAGAWTPGGTVLLVDDEETVRVVGADMLRALGFTVLTAGDGLEALETFRNTPGIALVLLDLTMPRLDGEQTFRALRKLDPGVKVVLSSGFNEVEAGERLLGEGLSGFLQKPYRLAALRTAVGAALGG